jgi:hypothetical protein
LEFFFHQPNMPSFSASYSKAKRSVPASIRAVASSDANPRHQAAFGHGEPRSPLGLYLHGVRDPQADARQRRYELRDGLRAHNPPSVTACGKALRKSSRGTSGVVERDAALVDVFRSTRGGAVSSSAYYTGLMQCDNGYLCPVCAHKQEIANTQELNALCAAWKRGGRIVLQMTLTIAHQPGDDPRRMVLGILAAQRRMMQGKPWRRFRTRLGLVHSVRSVEVSPRPGYDWHPHLHFLLFIDPTEYVEDLALICELRTRWQTMVTRQLGTGHTPRSEFGLQIGVSQKDSYAGKAELARMDSAEDDPQGSCNSPSPWQLATAAADGNVAAQQAWRALARAVARIHRVTWSRSLSALRKTLRAERVASMSMRTGSVIREHVASIPERLWHQVAAIRGASAHILRAAERHGRMGVAVYIHSSWRDAELHRGAARSDVWDVYSAIAPRERHRDGEP